MGNKSAFLDHLNRSNQTVKEWPSWKQPVSQPSSNQKTATAQQNKIAATPSNTKQR